MRTITVHDGAAASSFNVHAFGGGRPVFAFVGGVHGNEPAGVSTANLLVEYFEKHGLIRGTAVVVPAVNPTAAHVRKRCSPVDDADLNRCFPGNPEGSLTCRIADALWRETEDADYIIDLHGCDCESLPYLLTICDEFPIVRDLAEKIPMGIAVQSKGTGGQLFVEACRRRGQAAVVIELPGVKAAEQCFRALLEMLRIHGMIPGEPSSKPPVFYGGLKRLRLTEESTFEPCAVRGTVVEQGAVIGWADGKPVRMPENGLMLNICAEPRCFRSRDWCCAYAEVRAGKDDVGTCNQGIF